MTLDDIADRIAIGELKARYCRYLDAKRWDDWAGLFTGDLVLDTSEAGGPPPIAGRDEAVALVRATLEAARTVHQVHAPEIGLFGDVAHGIWAMQDRVIFANGDDLTGYGHYTETYRRTEAGWRIAATRLTRLHIDFTPGTPA